ncbi:hypothetical protein CMMCAS07_20560 [Clavibacter michiganensis subsp. michiganensis]|uniref:Uncharacterized protein n=1 Tax=Clavibacter michiganensis subsp. michiganensis TaxID=33013 RepID=A0A251XCJ4_CLAMM|nr:hypothetical protein CMMCAS07_20560 [Clavibacter michiganensis subsp. michiganensis]
MANDSGTSSATRESQSAPPRASMLPMTPSRTTARLSLTKVTCAARMTRSFPTSSGCCSIAMRASRSRRVARSVGRSMSDMERDASPPSSSGPCPPCAWRPCGEPPERSAPSAGMLRPAVWTARPTSVRSMPSQPASSRA